MKGVLPKIESVCQSSGEEGAVLDEGGDLVRVGLGIRRPSPGEASIGDILERWAAQGGENGGEVALGWDHAGFEIPGEVTGDQQLGILAGKADPGGVKVGEFLADRSKVFEKLGAEDVGFSFVFPGTKSHAGAGIQAEAAEKLRMAARGNGVVR